MRINIIYQHFLGWLKTDGKLCDHVSRIGSKKCILYTSSKKTSYWQILSVNKLDKLLGKWYFKYRDIILTQQDSKFNLTTCIILYAAAYTPENV